MFQWFLPAKEQKKIYTGPTMLYFANSAVGSRDLPPRLMHAHKERIEIAFISSGQGKYTINNHKLDVQKGDIVVIEPGCIHDERRDEIKNMHIFCCGMTGIKLPGLRSNCILPKGVLPVLHTGGAESHFSSFFYCMFEQLLLKKQEEALNVCNNLIRALLYMALQLPMESEVRNAKKDEIWITDNIRQFLDANYAQNVLLDEIAEKLNMSTSYLAHTFKEETGCSPGQYMIRRRIGEAQTLIQLTDHPITQISTMVGYDNTNYFSTIFKKTVGMKPKEYRDYYKGKEEGNNQTSDNS